MLWALNLKNLRGTANSPVTLNLKLTIPKDSRNWYGGNTSLDKQRALLELVPLEVLLPWWNKRFDFEGRGQKLCTFRDVSETFSRDFFMIPNDGTSVYSSLLQTCAEPINNLRYLRFKGLNSTAMIIGRYLLIQGLFVTSSVAKIGVKFRKAS